MPSSKRDNRTDALDKLDVSIRLRTEALELRPVGHPGRASALENLAWALEQQYDRSSSLDDLTTCIRLRTEALELRPTGHPDRVHSLMGLAWALDRRYDLSQSPEDLERSIQLFTEGLALYPRDHPNRDNCRRVLDMAHEKQRNYKKLRKEGIEKVSKCIIM